MRGEKQRRRKVYFMTVLLLGMLCLGGCSLQNAEPESGISGQKVSGHLEVHYIDVGQGDATLIKNGEHAMLIDAGENDQGENVCSYLESKGVEKLEYVVGTHPDSDHVGGLDVVLTGIECEEVLLPDVKAETKTYEDVETAVEETETAVIYPAVGDTYALGDAIFTVIAPNADYGEDKNDWSVGLLLEYGENRFLFTGDAEERAEEDILDNGLKISADVYKASHHGSKTASGEEFLDAVQPSAAVISCGEDNAYGHPSAQTLNSFRERGIEVYRTDEQGSIVAVSDGKTISFNTSPDESWKAGEPKGSEKGREEKSQDGKSQDGKTRTTYILNTNTKKYHRKDCARADTIEEKNRKISHKNKKQLAKEGYEPCGFCHP